MRSAVIVQYTALYKNRHLFYLFFYTCGGQVFLRCNCQGQKGADPGIVNNKRWNVTQDATVA